MSENAIQLPTDGAGQKLRLLLGEVANQIPAGENEEVIVLSDRYGILQGDERMRPVLVSEQKLDEVHMTLRQILVLLSFACGIEPPQPQDAINALGAS